MGDNRLWKKICAHVLSVFLILGMLGTGLPAIGAFSPQEAYAAAGINTVTKGQTVYLGPNSAPGAFDVAGAAANQWTVLDVQDAQGNSTTDAAEAVRVLMITKGAWMTYDDYNGGQGVKFANLDTWCESFYADVLNSDARIAEVDGKHAFCLTKDQANTLFADNNARKVDANNSWWLSTPYENIATYAYCVDTSGSVIYRNQTNEYYVRPAVYLDLTKVTCSNCFKNAWSLYDSHSFGKWTKKDDEKHQRTCSRDGFVEEAAHTWDDGVVADGVKTYTCADCGATKTEQVSQDPLITELSYNRTEFDADGGAVNVAITGNNLDKLTNSDFAIELKGVYGDWEAQTYAVPLTYTASGSESAALTFTLPANSETSEKEYRLTAKTGADSVSNKQQILKVAGVVKAELTSITYSATSLESAGGEVTATISGSNLDKFAQDDFRIHVEAQDEYLGPVYEESNIRPDSFEASAESATVKFTLPANATAEAKNYKVRVIKTRGQWGSNTYYKSDEVTGVDQVITVASAIPAAKITTLTYDKTELASEGGTVTATFAGEGLTGLSSSDFSIEKKDLVYDEEEYDYVEKYVSADIELTYAATDNSAATLTFTLPENTGNKDVLYRVTANKGADELSNKQQELTVKTSYVPPVITKVEVAPAEVSSASEPVTLTVTGTNLEKIWYQIFWYSDSDQYWNRDGWSVKTADANSSTSATVTLTPSTSAADGSKFRVYVKAEAPSGYPSNADDFDKQFEKTEWSVKVPAAKPEIESAAIDDYMAYMSGETQPAKNGVYAWYIEFPEGAATSDITDADFTMQMKTADSDWAASSDASAHFDFNENGAWVVGTVADNTEAYAKQWKFVYSGGGAECPVITQQAAETTDPLEEAKAAAKAELDNIDPNNYSGNEKAVVEAAISTALADIEAAETVDAVNQALQTAKNAVKGQKTNAQKAEDAEKTANDAKTAADTAAATAAESKAAAEEAAKTPGQAAVDAAEKAKTDADAAKEAADAYKEAAAAYAAAAETAYGAEAKKTKDAKAAAEAAAEAAETAGQAASDAATAVDTAKAEKEKAEAIEKAGDAEKAANDAKTAAETAAATAAESKAAAEEAAKTPGQAAVDAAEKAKTDADAAKAASDAYKEAADAYAAAAETAYGAEDEKTQAAKQAATEAATAAETAGQAASDAATAVDAAKADKDKADKAAKEKADKAAAEAAAAAEAKAKSVTTVTVNVPTVNAQAIDAAVKTAGGSEKYVTKIVLGQKVKKVKAKAFTKYKRVTTIEVKTKKLNKKSVKKALKGSKVKTIKVKIGNKKVNKKYVKRYKKIFTKKIAGKKVRVK